MPTAGRPLATSRFESLYAEPFGRWKPANCSRSVSNKLGGAGRDGDCCSEDLDGKKDGTQKPGRSRLSVEGDCERQKRGVDMGAVKQRFGKGWRSSTRTLVVHEAERLEMLP